MLRIKDWSFHFENNRTRELKKLDWVPVPNKMDGDGYTELVDHEDGAAHLGAWTAIVEIASKCEPRGVLRRAGRNPAPACGDVFCVPHDAASLSRLSRLSEKVFVDAIPRLIAIGWLEEVPNDHPDNITTLEKQAISSNPAPACDNPAPACGKAPMEWNGMEGKGRELNTPLNPPFPGGNENGSRSGKTRRPTAKQLKKAATLKAIQEAAHGS